MKLYATIYKPYKYEVMIFSSVPSFLISSRAFCMDSFNLVFDLLIAMPYCSCVSLKGKRVALGFHQALESTVATISSIIIMST